MKIPRGATTALVALEAVIMIVVLVLCVVHPWTTNPKNDVGGNNTELAEDEQGVEENTENAIGSIAVPGPNEVVVTFSDEVLAKVNAMTLEQKVAQMFIISPEALTGADKVTVAGNTTKNTLSEYPVGGLVYSAINFQNKTQTINLLKGVQEHYKSQFGMPMFLMIAEQGGAETSPLATVNKYTVEIAPAEVGAGGDSAKAVSVATNISTYLKEAGFNANITAKPQVYSQDDSLASIMIAETIATYKQKGILTVMSAFSKEDMGATATDSITYKAGIDAGADAIMLSEASEEVVKYLRANMQYGKLLIAETPAADGIVSTVNAGADMIYCPADFKGAYQSIIDAVNAGEISQEDIDTAVARILTCKTALEN